MKRGWCPGVFDPMESGDGLLVRVKPPLGRVTAVQMRVLAEAAQRHGNGSIGVTGRGNLQVRGLRTTSAAPFAKAMVACGLALGDPAAERRRRVIVSPIGGGAAEAIERAMLADGGLDALADKFVVLAGNGCAADIVARDGCVWVAGAEAAAVVAEPAAAVVRLAHVLSAHGGTRMRGLVDEVGAAAVYSAAELRADVAIPKEDSERLGVLAPGVVAGGLWCGETDAEGLAQVADVAERFGDGVVRVAPWRALVFGDVEDLDGLRGAAAGLIFDDADPRLRVTACVGKPRCARATVDARRDALGLVSSGLRIHVSGCVKGCADPGASEVTVVGALGRYDVVIAGSASDITVRRNVEASDLSKWIPKALPLAGSPTCKHGGRAPGLPS